MSEIGDDDERSINSVDKFDTDYPPEANIKIRVVPPEAEDSNHVHVGCEMPLKATSKPKSVDWWITKSKTSDHGNRPPFFPCNHSGLACDQANCRCFRDNVMCEKACGCAKACYRRYKGCSCKQRRNEVCHPKDRCECWRMNRECDPDLCRDCGAHLVLDRENKYDEALRERCCQNVSIQLGQPKRTLLGTSDIHGFGLYAGEAIKKDEYIGEYQGEILNYREMQRRDAIYRLQNQSYVFCLNSKQSIDSQKAGNKLRFINAASGNENLFARIVLCNMTHCIGMYAIRDIKKGDELFLDYGKDYPNSYLKAQESAISGSQNTKLTEHIVAPNESPISCATNCGAPTRTAGHEPRSGVTDHQTTPLAICARKSVDQDALRRRLGQRMFSTS